MLVDAISKRYGKGTKKERFVPLRRCAERVDETHRDDPNVLTVTAFAIWNAEDALFDGHDAPTPKANEMIADLDAALVLEPTNLGAHHLRIHLMEELAPVSRRRLGRGRARVVRLPARNVAPPAHERPHLGASREYARSSTTTSAPSRTIRRGSRRATGRASNT